MDLEYRTFESINLADPFFDSLKADYSEFPQWFEKKAKDRAYVFRTDDGRLDGFLYLKKESEALQDVDPPRPALNRLKVGTLKINAHGTKLGERFLKKIFDHAVHEKSREIYVTVFAKHEGLLALFDRYGFHQVAEKKTGNGNELVLLREMRWMDGDLVKNYPLVKNDNNRNFLLSLYPKWHTRLLPDSILRNEDADILQDVSHTNSIHKVYLTAMRGTDALRRGDRLLIYRTSDQPGRAYYRSVVTSICVVEEARSIFSFEGEEAFLAYCRPYSVFTEAELKAFFKNKKNPNLIRFTYNIAFQKRPNRKALLEEVGMDATKYWGFFQLSAEEFKTIVARGEINESLIVY